jgi:hypothetical protein
MDVPEQDMGCEGIEDACRAPKLHALHPERMKIIQPSKERATLGLMISSSQDDDITLGL